MHAWPDAAQFRAAQGCPSRHPMLPDRLHGVASGSVGG